MAFFSEKALRKASREMRYMTGGQILLRLSKNPELQKMNTQTINSFVEERDGAFEVPTFIQKSSFNQPSSSLSLPCKTMADIVSLEESLSQDSVDKELVCVHQMCNCTDGIP